MKTETTKGVEFKTAKELRAALVGYIDEFYNPNDFIQAWALLI